MRQLQIKSLPSKKEQNWVESTELLFHAYFQVFEDFLVKDFKLENLVPYYPSLETGDWYKEASEEQIKGTYDYWTDENARRAEALEIYEWWQEQKKHSCCWSRAHAELEHKIEGILPEMDDWLEPPLTNGDRVVKKEREPNLYWETLTEMSQLEEAYEYKINEMIKRVAVLRQWMWT